MPTVLGRNVKSSFAARLKGRLFPATLTKKVAGTYDYENPGGGTRPTDLVYQCEGMSFAYTRLLADGEQTVTATYRVMLYLGSFMLAGEAVDAPYIIPGDIISIAPPGSDTPLSGTIETIQSLTPVAITVTAGGLISG